MKKIKAHMICHTHWDREWYLTREEFRVKLVRLIDGLLDIIEKNADYVSFMLDGQTIALEDYLQIKPENTERLKKALKSRKIVCGPWYILPDELLVSGESHIRNYLMGQKVMNDMGGAMQTAYLPDSFGHPQQMPQIIKGLGMDAMVFWRGTAEFMKNSEFIWSSPHIKSQILCVHMPFGYGNSARLDKDQTKSRARLMAMISDLKARSTTDIVLLMNGSDHITGQENIVEIVKAFNESRPEAEIKLSTLESFIEELQKELPSLETYVGEFRYSERSMLLGGTLSTRMPLKQKNHIVQCNMEKYLEPVLVFERLSGRQNDMQGYLDYLWKKILENHPHDSICGCSIDAVHAEMMTRFDGVTRLQNILLSDAFKRVGMLAQKAEKSYDAQLLVFEPSQDKIPSYIEACVDLDQMLVQEASFEKSIIVDYEDQINHPKLPEALRVVDDMGREIECHILSANKDYYTCYQDETLPEIYKVNRVKIGLMLPELDYGFHLLNICRMDKTEKIQNALSESEIENAYYTVSFENGAFKLTDKKTGRIYHGVGRLVDKGDAGDEYTYSWPLNDELYSLDANDVTFERETSSLCQKLIISGAILLPEKLSEDRRSRSKVLVHSPVKITVSLYKGIDRIDFKTEIHNNSCDHRLQAEFPSGILTNTSRAENCFGMTTRDIDLKIPENWMEYPQSTHPVHGVITLNDKKEALSAISKGLTEFEAENAGNKTVLRITLFRSVGWLSRTDLITRKGNGGWTIATPDSQLIGDLCFEYSITYHKTDDEGKAYVQLVKHNLPARIEQLRKSTPDIHLPFNPLSFVSNLPRDIRLSALKPSEKGDSIILRLYSLADEDREIKLDLPDLFDTAYRVNLAEKRLNKLEIRNDTLAFHVEPAQIVTLEFCCKEGGINAF